MKKWRKWHKRYHKSLYLHYRKEELIWHLDIFLCVNHPQRYVDAFIDHFINNRRTIRQMFARGLVCEGHIVYTDALPYQQDMDRFIGFMRLRQYIKVTEDMKFNDIMALNRVFDLSVMDRFMLKQRLLNR